jgi:hypothetical protein
MARMPRVSCKLLMMLALCLSCAVVPLASAEAETILRTSRLDDDTLLVESPHNATMQFSLFGLELKEFQRQEVTFAPIWSSVDDLDTPVLQSSLKVVQPAGSGEDVYLDFFADWPPGVSEAFVAVSVSPWIQGAGSGSLPNGVPPMPAITNPTSADVLLTSRWQGLATRWFDFNYQAEANLLIPGLTLEAARVLPWANPPHALRFLISRPDGVDWNSDEPLMRLTFTEVSTTMATVYVPEPASWVLLLAGGVAAACFRRRRKLTM